MTKIEGPGVKQGRHLDQVAGQTECISIGKQFILLKEKGLESSSPFHQIAQIPAQTSFA
ncbi:hypothetical protein MUS_0727 [Bacillus velezensis YAU B9601-Y2]|uniref:Uncharacterized protein n=1 Tax=Bacillus amyloliquefaciens (strain Y2) TaxID=1155777 RepID=I2C2B6_BACAY|nr:hypothetical protein MUS_0727 [Bacillus velezensis YAU B9601-Y2]RUS03771.1 hypothetical protein EFW58_03454 [Bacillus velezensis]